MDSVRTLFLVFLEDRISSLRGLESSFLAKHKDHPYQKSQCLLEVKTREGENLESLVILDKVNLDCSGGPNSSGPCLVVVVVL